MVEFKYNKFVTEAMSEAAVVTGIPRSGTSIIGQLVGSLSTIEYAYEPPMVNFLDASVRHETLDPSTVMDFFFPYLYYDYFLNYIHGRRYNFRESDFSYVLDMKTVPEVLEQWSRVAGIQDAVDVASEFTFSFKYPGFYDALALFFEEIPSLRVIDIGRGLDRILASLYDKEWFFDHSLEPGSAGRWPYHRTDGLLVPYLVEEADVDEWQVMSAEDRTVYVCNRFAEGRTSFKETFGARETYHEVRYERFVERPETVAGEITDFLDVTVGPATDDVVEDVESTSQAVDVDDILSTCDDERADRFANLRSEIG